MADDDVDIKFGASLEGLQAGIGEAKEAIEGISGPISEIVSSFGELGEALAAAFAFEKIAEFAEQMGELGEQTERTSIILGISTEQVSELNFVAAMTGSNTESLAMMMGRFEAALPGAEGGLGRVAAGLRSLGLGAKELEAMNPSQQIREIAEAVSKFGDGAAKMAVLQDLGRGFVQFIPLLDEGAEGFDELTGKAREAGVVLDALMTKQLVDMQHGMVNLKETTEGAAISGFKPFIEVVNGAVAITTDLTKGFMDSVNAGGFIHDALNLVSDGLKQVEQFIGETILLLKDIGIDGDFAFASLTDAVTGFGKAAKDIFDALFAAIPGFFTGLVTAGEAAFEAVEKAAIAFGAVLNDTLHLNFDGAKADFAAMGDAGAAAMAKIEGAFGKGVDLTKLDSDAKTTFALLQQNLEIRNNAIAAAAEKAKEQYYKIWGPAKDPRGGEAAGVPTDDNSYKPAPPTPVPQTKGKQDNSAAKDAAEDAATFVKLWSDAAATTEAVLDGELKRHEISTAQWLAGTKDALADELQDTIGTYQKELQVATLTAQQRKAISDKMVEAEAANAVKVVKAEQKAADETAAAWKAGADKIADSFNSQVDGLLTGTETFAKAFKNMLASAIEDVVKFCVKWAAEHAATIAMNMAGDMAGAASATGAAGASLGATLAAKGAIVTSDMGQAGAGVAAFLAPFLGPAAIPAGEAAAASVGGIGMMDIGAYRLPFDQLALVHQNELVMPAGPAGAFRDMLEGGGAGRGGGDVHVHPTVNVSAMDGASVKRVFHDNSDELLNAIQYHASRGGRAALRRLARGLA